MLFNILLATFLSSFVSLIGALALAKKSNWSQPFALYLTALSSGVLLTTALMHLGPEAIEEGGEVGAVFGTMFTAIILFFFLERSVLWYHHHHQSHGPQPSAWLITIGDSVHNFIDGVALASTFMLNPAIGFMTMVAIGAHEIPQEIADFAVLVNGGVSRKKALILNMISALAAFAGALITYAVRDTIELYVPYLAAFSAGMFLYIALSDLIPELHHKTTDQRGKWLQLIWFGAGIGLIFAVTNLIGETH